MNITNFKNALSREEMRDIKGGITYPYDEEYVDDPSGGGCKSECNPNGPNTCKTVDCPNSYCATYHCGPSNIRVNNCQYQ